MCGKKKGVLGVIQRPMELLHVQLTHVQPPLCVSIVTTCTTALTNASFMMGMAKPGHPLVKGLPDNIFPLMK